MPFLCYDEVDGQHKQPTPKRKPHVPRWRNCLGTWGFHNQLNRNHYDLHNAAGIRKTW